MAKEIKDNRINDGGYTTLYEDGTVEFGLPWDAPFQVSVEEMRKIVKAFDIFKARDNSEKESLRYFCHNCSHVFSGTVTQNCPFCGRVNWTLINTD